MATYIARADIEAYFGGNVAMWADVDRDEDTDKITARVNIAISSAEAELHARMRGGPYAVPLAGMTDSTQYVTKIVAYLAAFDLYSTRGVIASEEEQTRMEGVYEWAVDQIRGLLANTRSIDAGRAFGDMPDAAIVV